MSIAFDHGPRTGPSTTEATVTPQDMAPVVADGGGRAGYEPLAAWNACRRAVELEGIGFNMLLAALLHAGRMGATVSVKTAADAADPDRLTAARVFAQIQVQLLRSNALAAIDRSTLSMLLQALPRTWSDILRQRIEEHGQGSQPSSTR